MYRRVRGRLAKPTDRLHQFAHVTDGTLVTVGLELSADLTMSVPSRAVAEHIELMSAVHL